MNENYRAFFGFETEPFGSDIALSDILVTDDLAGVSDRIAYAVRLGGAALVTGDIAGGKSTALRYAGGRLHPSEYQVMYVTASSGSILELYRQVLSELGVDTSSFSRAVLTGRIKREIAERAQNKKMKAVLVIDEASLLRLKVFRELHTLAQFNQDTSPWLPLILAGQSNLIDESAVTAIHQGSGGLFGKANHLARGAPIAAAGDKSMTAAAEHVRSHRRTGISYYE